MENLRIPLDSFLKRFNLFTEIEDWLDQYDKANPQEEEQSLDEITARSNFYQFLDLAVTLDTYANWTDDNWTNYLMYMLQAYHNKGNSVAINCALAALGVQVSQKIDIEDVYVNVETGEEWGDSYTTPDLTEYTLKTKVTIVIDTIQTPLVEIFLERLADLLPELLWLHDLDISNSYAEIVWLTADVHQTYSRTFYYTGVRYSKIDGYEVVTS